MFRIVASWYEGIQETGFRRTELLEGKWGRQPQLIPPQAGQDRARAEIEHIVTC